MAEDSKHSTRVAVVSALVSLVLSIVFAAYIVGQRTGKVLEIDKWKNETAPRIEKMDLEGSVATKNFALHSEKEMIKHDERLKALEHRMNDLWSSDRLKELEQDTRQIDVLKTKIERLERNHNRETNP